MKDDTNVKFEDLPEILSLDDIANYLRVTKPVVITMIEENNIPTIKVGKKLVRIKKEVIRDFIGLVEIRYYGLKYLWKYDDCRKYYAGI